MRGRGETQKSERETERGEAGGEGEKGKAKKSMWAFFNVSTSFAKL